MWRYWATYPFLLALSVWLICSLVLNIVVASVERRGESSPDSMSGHTYNCFDHRDYFCAAQEHELIDDSHLGLVLSFPFVAIFGAFCGDEMRRRAKALEGQ